MKFLKFRGSGDEIRVYGLFGFPLGHSLSAEMQNAAFRAVGIPAAYFAFERNRRQFLKLVKSRRKMVLDGFNLTIPYKEAILPYLDKIDPAAKLAGAVNTVRKVKNRWIGYNTDIYGFLEGLKDARFHPRGKKVVILGAGGAARSVITALAKSGAKEIVIANRTRARAKSLASEFQRKFRGLVLRSASKHVLKSELANADLLVNATSVGLNPKDTALLSKSDFPKRKIFVYDLIYHVGKTPLLKLAAGRGCRVLNGGTMLLMQGAKAFEIWTSRKAPIKVMRKALQDAVRAA